MIRADRVKPGAAGLLVVLFVVVGLAAEGRAVADSQAPVPDAIRAVNNTVSVSGIARRVSYEEQNNGLAPGAADILDTENGWIDGFLIEGTLEQRVLGLTDLFVRARVALAWGDLAYDGATQAGMPVTATSDASMTDVDLTIGIGFGAGRRAAVTPILTYAFRDWNRGLDKGQPSAYHETYASHELDAGVLGQFLLGERLLASVSATAGGLLHTSIDIEPIPPATLDLGSSLVLRGEVGLTYQLTTAPRLHVFLAYGIRRFGFGRSPTTIAHGYSVTEPDSETLQQDVRAGLALGF